MASRSGPLRLRQSNVPEEALAPAHGGKGPKAAGPGAAHASSKAAVCVDRENPAYGGFVPFVPSPGPTTTRKAASAKRRSIKGKAPAATLETKSKAGTGCAEVEGDKPAEAAAVEGDKPAEAVAVAAAMDADGEDGGEATVEGKKLTILPAEEVAWILGHQPRVIENDDEEWLRRFYAPEMIERVAEIMRQGVEAAASMREKFLDFQAWVRTEYDTKGCVAVDDEFLAGREQVRQWVREMFDDLPVFPHSYFGDYSDMYATDTDEEEAAVKS